MTRIITALDFDNVAAASRFVECVDPSTTRLKIGKQLFMLGGPALVEQWQAAGFDIFLDLKFHDIPNTVAGALQAAAALGVWMVNVHASGGPAMLQAARDAVSSYRSAGSGQGGTRLIAVTVLTSLDQAELHATGLHKTPQEQVELLTGLALDAGMDGVVCSAQEIELIRQLAGPDFLTVTPGIRPKTGTSDTPVATGSDGVRADDQRRVMDPVEAVRLGGDFLVIGRPVTRAASPPDVLQELNSQIQAADKQRNVAPDDSQGLAQE